MSKLALTNAKLWLDGYDLSGDINALALEYGAEAKDATVISDTTRRFMGGLKTVSARHAGLWEAGTDKVDEVLFARVGSNVVTTIGPSNGGAEGERAYLTTMLGAKYGLGGAVGEAFPFDVELEGQADLVAGTIIHNALRGLTGAGTVYNLGAPSASQRWFAALHVLTLTGGGTLTVKVQSDDNAGMTSPTDRGTFAAKSGLGAEIISAVGIGGGDIHWRTSWTLTGSSPSALFVVALGFI